MRRGLWNWLFLLSSFGLGLFFLFLIYQESFPEWKPIQAEYYRRLAEVTGDPTRAAAPLEIKQIYLPRMNRVDRCITCHVGVDNPRMANQPQPFRTHPDLGIPGFLVAHSFTEVGCTVCHGGQGRATELLQAHGPVKHWEEPLLPASLTVSSCTACHGNVQTLQGAEQLVLARQFFDEKGCIGCHMLHGWGNQIGPELADTAEKGLDQFDFRHVQGEHTKLSWIIEHFKDPQGVTPADPILGIPESSMPNFELTDEETLMLTALVLSFSAEKGNELKPIPAHLKVPAPEVQEPVYASVVEHGEAVFRKYGCAACHGPAGRGGIRNKNMDMGEEIPPLIYVASGFTEETIKEVIREGRYPARSDPQQPAPPLWMPAWGKKISEEELSALVKYLFSLYPESREKMQMTRVAELLVPDATAYEEPMTMEARE